MNLLSFLKENPVAALASLNSKGLPDMTAIYLHVEEDLTLLFVTKTKTRKLKNITDNPNVSLLVHNAEELMSAEIHGKASIINDGIEFAQTIEKFRKVFESQKIQYWFPPITQLAAGEYIACKVKPQKISFKKFAVTPEQKPFSKEFTFN